MLATECIDAPLMASNLSEGVLYLIDLRFDLDDGTLPRARGAFTEAAEDLRTELRERADDVFGEG